MTLIEFFKYELFTIGQEPVTALAICLPIILLLLAWIFNILSFRYVLKPFLERSDIDKVQRQSIKRLFSGFVYFLALYLSVYILYHPDQTNEQLSSLGRFFSILKVIFASASLIYGIQLLIWLLNDVILRRYFKTKNIDQGRQFTITRLIMYVGVTFGALAVLQVAGVKLTLLLGGGAALLVGVGLGLQQTFNDLFSGIVILVEGTVAVGDIVKVDDIVARMRKIGLRVSEVETRDNSVLLIPNSKLVVENVHNWSNDIKPTRFQVNVGVSYTSDVRLVEKLLLEAAKDHTKILKNPKPRVQFADFGNSSLNFALHFYSDERYFIEFVKSDIRFRIVALFREHGIEIPFPQRDLWIRNPEDLHKKTNPPQAPADDLD